MIKKNKKLIKNLNYKHLVFLLLFSSELPITKDLLAASILSNELKDEKIHEKKLEYERRELELEKSISQPLPIHIKKSETQIIEEEIDGNYFKEIIIEGDNLLINELKKESLRFLNKKMNNEEIYKLIESLTDYLHKKGYITSAVLFKEGNVYDGRIVLEVSSGRIDNIYFKNSSKEDELKDKIKINMAFPNYKERILNIRYIDQGMENLNNSGWRHQMEIVEKEDGYSDIVIYRKKNMGYFDISYDNSPVEEDRKKINFSYNTGNILSLNDSLYLALSEKLGPKRENNKEHTYDLAYSVPYGTYKFSYNLNISKTHNASQGVKRKIIRDSNTIKHRLRLTKVISRGETHKTTIGAFLSLRDKESYINKRKILVQSKKYTTAGLSLNHSDIFLGGHVNVSLQYERGLPRFGAEGDKNYQKGDIRKEFDKYTLNIDWRKRFQLKNGDTLQYRTSIGSMYSDDITLDLYKLSIGDEYTVRGFKRTGISGEKGVYIANTLSYQFSAKRPQYLQYFSPFIGLDGGIVRDRTLPESDRLVGMAVGLKFNKENLYSSITYGIPIKRSKFNEKEKNAIYFNIGYSF